MSGDAQNVCAVTIVGTVLKAREKPPESFILQDIFPDIKKIFCDSSFGMELESEKRAIKFSNNWLPFQCSKINKYEGLLFKLGSHMPPTYLRLQLKMFGDLFMQWVAGASAMDRWRIQNGAKCKSH